MGYVRKTNNPKMGRPTLTPLTHNLKVWLDENTFELFSSFCQKADKSKSEVARTIIQEYLSKEG